MTTTAERQAANLQFPGDAIFIASSTSATYHPIPEAWKGKFVEVTGIGTAVYLRTDPAYVAVATTAASTVANDDDADGLLASGGASSAGAQTVEGAEFNGVIDEADIDPPRRVSMTFSSHADWDATTATVTGTDADGTAITDTITIPNGGNAIASTTKRFASVSSIAIPAQSGTGGTFTVGVLDSNAITFAGTEPHVYAADGQTKSLRIKAGDVFFNHVEGTGSALVLIALATGDED